MSDPLDQAIALALASCIAPQSSAPRDLVKVTIKAGKVQRVKGTALPNVQGETKSTPDVKDHATADRVKHNGPPPLCFFPVGTLDARGFLKAINAAPSRDLRIQAIAAFIGYDRKGDFASQEFNARQSAQRMIRGVNPAMAIAPLRGESRTVVRSVEGFVAGLPNGAARKVQDLIARERLAVEELATYEKVANDPSVAAEGRTLATGQAEFERARLSEIRSDLAKLLPTDQAAE